MREEVTITYNGITKPLHVWARERGHIPATYHHRKRSGWSDKEIIETPIKFQETVKSEYQVSDNAEAFSGLTKTQLATLAEFDQIAQNGRYE